MDISTIRKTKLIFHNRRVACIICCWKLRSRSLSWNSIRQMFRTALGNSKPAAVLLILLEYFTQRMNLRAIDKHLKNELAESEIIFSNCLHHLSHPGHSISSLPSLVSFRSICPNKFQVSSLVSTSASVDIQLSISPTSGETFWFAYGVPPVYKYDLFSIARTISDWKVFSTSQQSLRLFTHYSLKWTAVFRWPLQRHK